MQTENKLLVSFLGKQYTVLRLVRREEQFSNIKTAEGTQLAVYEIIELEIDERIESAESTLTDQDIIFSRDEAILESVVGSLLMKPKEQETTVLIRLLPKLAGLPDIDQDAAGKS